MRYSTLKDQLRDSKARERSARIARDDALAFKRSECAAARVRIKDDCRAARERIRAAAGATKLREKAYRDEARADYRHAVGLSERGAPKGRRYSKRESDSLARHNIPPHLSDLFDELAPQFPYELEPDHRAELFLEWVEAHGREVVDWQAEHFGGDDDFAAAYAAYQAEVA